MSLRIVPYVLSGLLVTVTLFGGDIQGRVIIHRQLTKWTVTAPSSTYHRGAAVELASDAIIDPLAFERTHVVVYLEGQLPSEPITAMLEQKHRRFTQDLLIVPAGSTVSFPNQDPIFHNVFSLGKPKVFDLGSYPKGQTRTVNMPVPGVVYVNCHLHPNMAAVIVVTPNGWNTRPDTSGNFSLKNVPAGRYTIVAWHKSAGFFRQAIEVQPDTTATVAFVLPLKEDGKLVASH
jgi:plastocyanin